MQPHGGGNGPLHHILKIATFVAFAALAGCDNTPEHYYVLCDATDGMGWSLIDTTSENGYLMSCTYQSPDRQHVRTDRCTSDGCD